MLLGRTVEKQVQTWNKKIYF